MVESSNPEENNLDLNETKTERNLSKVEKSYSIVEVKRADEYVYPRPADLEVIDVTSAFNFSTDVFKVPDRYKPYIEYIILPDGILKNRWVRLAE